MSANQFFECAQCYGLGELTLVSFGLDLFRRLLFTKCWTSTDLLWPGGLIYNETTRMRLNDIVLRLVGRDLVQVKEFFEYLDALVPCREDDELDTGAFS